MKRGSYIVLGLVMLVGILMAGAPIGAIEGLRAPVIHQCTNVVADDSFEAGNWLTWTAVGTPWFADYWSHEGDLSAVLGGDNDQEDAFYQDVVIPAGATGATFRFWWRVYTLEGGIGTPLAKDRFYAILHDYLGNEYEVEALSNLSDTSDWWQSEFALDPAEFPTFFGHTVRIEFRATTDGEDFTSFYVDEVELIVCGAPVSTATPTATVATPCPPDDYEENPSFEQAWAIEPEVDYTAYICPSGDADWYRIYVLAESEMRATLSGVEGDLPADYDLFLYSPANEQVASSVKGGGASEEIVYVAPISGDYRLLVMGYAGAWSAGYPYRLRVELGGLSTATPTSSPTSTATLTATATSTATWTPTPTHTTQPGTLTPTATQAHGLHLPLVMHSR